MLALVAGVVAFVAAPRHIDGLGSSVSRVAGVRILGWKPTSGRKVLAKSLQIAGLNNLRTARSGPIYVPHAGRGRQERDKALAAGVRHQPGRAVLTGLPALLMHERC